MESVRGACPLSAPALDGSRRRHGSVHSGTDDPGGPSRRAAKGTRRAHGELPPAAADPGRRSLLPARIARTRRRRDDRPQPRLARAQPHRQLPRGRPGQRGVRGRRSARSTATGAARGPVRAEPHPAGVPQLGAMSATRWAALLRPGRAAELPTAFALESVSNAVAYLVGPALVSALAAAGHPMAGTVLAVSLSVAGGLLLAAQRGSAPAPAARSAPHSRSRSLLRGDVFVLMGLNLAIGVYFGALQVSVTAFVVEHRAPGAAGATAAHHRRLDARHLAAAHGRLTVRARMGRGADRRHDPAPSGALVPAHRVDRPSVGPDPRRSPGSAPPVRRARPPRRPSPAGRSTPSGHAAASRSPPRRPPR